MPRARALWPLAATQLLATLVLAASLYVGVGALSRDLSVAFHHAPPSVLPPEWRDRLATLRELVPSGESVLVLAGEDLWYPRLLQRALYPRNPVIVRQVARGTAAEACAQLGVRYVIWWDEHPPDLAFAWQRRLGALPGLASPMTVGAISR